MTTTLKPSTASRTHRPRRRPVRPFSTITRPAKWQNALLLTFAAIVLGGELAAVAEARLLGAYEQAYGNWDVNLRRRLGRPWLTATTTSDDMQMMFPKRNVAKVINSPAEDAGEVTNESLSSDERDNPTGIQKPPLVGRIARCNLCLERNGMFKLSITSSDDGDYFLPLRGEWFLSPNPYCVTDRQYDTLTLVSKPRVRINSRSELTERATVELRCKVWGRYGMGAVRKFLGMPLGRDNGRMTHGTIVIVRDKIRMDGSQENILSKKEVIGNFSGMANVVRGLEHSYTTTHRKEQDRTVMEDNDVDYDSDDFDL